MRSTLHRILLAVGMIAGLGSSTPMSAAPSPLYENSDVVNAPMIDAITFINRGVFNISAPDIPYETQNTRNYTNFPGAVIQGSGGMRFDLIGEDGFRHPAASFYNGGLISLGSGGGGFTGGFFFGIYNNSWILIDATNVVNRGGLEVGPEGLMKIVGENVQMSRSGLRAGEDPNQPISQGSILPPDNYTNDSGVQDLYAGAGVNNVLDPAGPGPFQLSLITGTPARSGPHEVLTPGGSTNRVQVSAPNVFARTNTVSPTNWVIQLIIVDTNSIDPLFKTAVKWGPPRMGDVPGAQMAMVQYTFEDVDTITGESFTNFVYVLDNLGTLTNAVLQTNLFNTNYTRPSSLLVTRVTPPEWANGSGTNVAYTPDLIVNPNYGGAAVTNVYAAYSANIGSASRISIGGGGGGGGGFGGLIPELFHPTNLPGRIEIDAQNLDLGLTRFRSEGLLTVKAAQITPRPPLKVDSALVSMDLGSTNGLLVVSNLVETTVRRFSGSVSCWSGAWTNTTFSTGPDPADPTLTVTNTIEIRFHALIVQRNFQTIVPVETINFIGRAENLVIWDDLDVANNFAFGFLLETRNLEINSQVNAGTYPLSRETLPNLVTLTNRGNFVTSDLMRLGEDDRPIGYVMNSGTLRAPFVALNSEMIENRGQVASSSANVEMKASAIKLEGGSVNAGANLLITAPDVKVQSTLIQTGGGSFGGLFLDVRDRLTDGGLEASNVFRVTDGIQLLRRPAEGDLSGTIVTSVLNRFREGIHIWAGDDRGATVAGFTNNAALGRLVLDGTTLTLFTFAGPDTARPYALYTDYLELLNGALDLEFSFNVATNFTVYFADSNVNPEDLDGALGGRLRWVRSAAGPFSGAPLTLASGQRVLVNRALLASTTIDSDEDGIPNAQDPNPFETPPLRVNVRMLAGNPTQAEVSWPGAPGGRYRVEYSPSLTGGEWQPLTNAQYGGAVPGLMSISDSVVAPDEPRFYRVVEVR